MKTKIRNVLRGAAVGSLASLLGACAGQNITVTQIQDAPEAQPVGPGAPLSGPSHSSAWAGVLPNATVNTQPLAMAEFTEDSIRNNEALGVVTGPPGQPMSYYATAEAPSLYLQYQFTLNQTANNVTVFRRPADVVYYRPYAGYYRAP